jgi:hypothetical protein
MARPRRHPTFSTQQQLSLDDCAHTLSHARDAAESQPAAPGADARASLGAGAKKNEAVRCGDAGVASRSCPVAIELLAVPDALLTRTHLRQLGLERRAVDAVFRALPVVALPGYSRPLVRAHDYLKLVESNTFNDDRVRPIVRAS